MAELVEGTSLLTRQGRNILMGSNPIVSAHKLNIMKNEFINFIREKGVIGLAVGIIVGGAVTAFVNSIITNLVDPVIGALVGKGGNLASYSYTIPHTDITFGWGSLISDLITFISILLVVYLLFVKSPINKLDKPKE